jgi:hypothetical protein
VIQNAAPAQVTLFAIGNSRWEEGESPNDFFLIPESHQVGDTMTVALLRGG